MTASGSLPAVQPVTAGGGGGMSASLPFGAPASTHAATVAICSGVRLPSFLNFPKRGSAAQGGISREVTLLRIAFAQGRTSS